MVNGAPACIAVRSTAGRQRPSAMANHRKHERSESCPHGLTVMLATSVQSPFSSPSSQKRNH